MKGGPSAGRLTSLLEVNSIVIGSAQSCAQIKWTAIGTGTSVWSAPPARDTTPGTHDCVPSIVGTPRAHKITDPNILTSRLRTKLGPVLLTISPLDIQRPVPTYTNPRSRTYFALSEHLCLLMCGLMVGLVLERPQSSCSQGAWEESLQES